MTATYRAAVIGCGRIGAFIDNESASPLPWSHAAGYVACPRTDLAALSDQRADVMDRAGERYGVPPERRYRDYREMLARERPDIVSVATQPEQRAELVIYAAEHGARAIYAEKPMAASLAQADAMVAAAERHGVAFNMGTNRRWEAPYDVMKELIHGGRHGRLLSMTIHQGHGLFNMGSHVFDLFQWLNDDQPVEWVQFHLTRGGDDLDGGLLDGDPNGGGRLQFANGVAAFAADSGRPFEVEVVCERAVIGSLGLDGEFPAARARRGEPPREPRAAPRHLPALHPHQLHRQPDRGPRARAGHGPAAARRGARRARQHGADLRLHRVAPPRRRPRGSSTGGQRPAPGAPLRSAPAALRAIERCPRGSAR